MNVHWYALKTKPHKERAVQGALEAQQLEVFLPLLAVKPKNPRAAKLRPFFPGYMFVNINLEAVGKNTLNWTHGVQSLVSFGGEPAIVPAVLIDDLRSRVNKINHSKLYEIDNLRKGDKVRIVRGPFKDYEAIFDLRRSGRDRVQILISFLSKQLGVMQIDSADIERI